MMQKITGSLIRCPANCNASYSLKKFLKFREGRRISGNHSKLNFFLTLDLVLPHW